MINRWGGCSKLQPPYTFSAERFLCMKFYKKLYVGEMVKNPRKVKRKLNRNAGLVNIYIIALCKGPDQLEIYPSYVLMQPFYRVHSPYVIGIASSYEEAVEIVRTIVEESLHENGDCDLKKYLLYKERLHDK